MTTLNSEGEESSRRVVDMKTIEYKMVDVPWSEQKVLFIKTKCGAAFYIRGDLSDLVQTWQDQIH